MQNEEQNLNEAQTGNSIKADVTSSAVKKNGKVYITEKQKQQFNKMLNSLKKIKAYQTPDRLRKDSEKDWGLDFEEAIEMAYENIQSEAAFASKNVKPLQ